MLVGHLLLFFEWNVFLILCPFLNWICIFVVELKIRGFFCIFWILDCDFKYFLPFYMFLFYFPDVLWCKNFFLIFMKSNLSYFFLLLYVLSVSCKNSLPNPRSWRFSSVFLKFYNFSCYILINSFWVIFCIWCKTWKWKSLSRVQFFVTPWTIQPMEFSWSG